MKDRISKALVQIKKDKKYYRKCNTALGALPYNESLFDFVFIPHDFRNGDIVRSLYGGWNTIEFCEKVGIILSYFDKDYEFYKNLRGDYSDAQVCVDIKFDGVAYQGEFEHEHIEEKPELYKSIKNEHLRGNPIQFNFFPSKQEIAERQKYFEEKRQKYPTRTIDRFYQDELVETLNKRFNQCLEKIANI